MSAAGPREVSNSVVSGLIRYLDRAGGRELTEEVLRRAGCDRSADEVLAQRWTSGDEAIAIASAAAILTGDPEIGRRAGEEMFRTDMASSGTVALLVSRRSPAAALATIIEYTGKMGRGRRYRIVSSSDAGMVIDADYVPRRAGHPFFCGIAMGYWPLVATLFGGVGTITHPTCQCRGDAHCRFVVAWDPGVSVDPAEVHQARAELRRHMKSFEEMQAIGEELARAADLQSLAEKILDAVDVIAPAPGVVVAIRSQPNGDPLTAWRGLPESAARYVAERLLEGTYDDRYGVALSASLSERGVIAAVAPDLQTVPGPAASMLQTFARHAGARLEAVEARQQAEQDRRTADLLLQLARSLSGVTSQAEVAQCLAKAIPGLTGCDYSSVLRWSPDEHALRPAACLGPTEELPWQELTVKEVPALFEVATRTTPFVLLRDRAPRFIEATMDEWGEDALVVVPLLDKSDFLGLLCAGYRDRAGIQRDLAFTRLQGAADLAVTALAKGRLLEEIRHQAMHDTLTGLPNRTLLEEQFRLSMLAADLTGRKAALLFLDLDRFKNVNDSLGHEWGDALIRGAAERISGVLRDGDILARMGGDEFVVALRDLASSEDVEPVAARILEDLAQPFDLGGQQVYASASIGVAVYPDDGRDYGSLLQRSDRAMYAAKAAGRATYLRHRSDAPPVETGRRLTVEAELHRALDTDQVYALYQPQVDLDDLQVVGAEALIRWAHPRLGTLAPAEFLPIAEECGLMAALDRMIRRSAFAQAASWRRQFGRISVAVNLSGQSLSRPTLLEEVAIDLAETGADPEVVELEVTEGMVAEEQLIPVVEGLAEMGLGIAIDDFGTGASAFHRLQRLPVHTLKIDRSLVHGCRPSRNAPILGGLIRMAHSLGMRVVAEGVENPSQGGQLRRYGCDVGQGFLFGRPMAPAGIEEILYSQITNLQPPAELSRRRREVVRGVVQDQAAG